MTAERSRPPVLAGPVPRGLVALLVAFTSLVVLTTDVYLPVLPDLGADLGASRAAAAATVSAVLVGIGVGQIVIGPVSDAVGRRRPLMLGVLAYAVTHLLSALAPSIGVLLALRLVAGLATAACIVVARAVVADVFPGQAAARAFATLGAAGAIAPVVAPLLGGGLATVMGWRGMFGVLAAAAGLLSLVAWRGLTETLPVERRTSPHLGAVLRDLGSVLRIRPFLAYVGAIAAFGGILFGYIGASSFVLRGSFGLSPGQYSLVFALNSVAIFVVSNLNRLLVGRVSTARLLALGQAQAVVGTFVLAGGVAAHLLVWVMLGLFVSVSAVGFVMPSALTLGMVAAGGRAGSASGVMGICQFAAGALASPLAGLGGTPWSLVAVIGTCAVLGPLCVRALRERPL